MKNYFANELSNIGGADEDLRMKMFPEEDSGVDGGDGGDEEITDYEGEESEVSGGVPASDLPRFRDLVRAKKLELKAQYGKGHFKNESYTTNECKNVPYPCPTWKEPLKICYKQVCINVPRIRIVWVSGWRKRWREFKQSGGLAQLRQQAKGTAPLNTAPSTTPPPISNPPVGIRNILVAEPIGMATTIAPIFKRGIADSAIKVEEPKPKAEEQTESKPTEETSSQKTTTSEEKKFLGMPFGVGIGVTVVGVAALGFVAWKLLKK